MVIASSNVHAPMGITIRSWMSMRRPACAPPPKICTSGIGSDTGPSSARYCHSGMSKAIAPACATASDTATVALPPSLLLFGVPSSSISLASIVGLLERIHAEDRARDRAAHVGDRLRDVVAAEPRAAVAQVDGLARAARRAGGRDAAADDAAREAHFGFDGRPAARIEDAPRVHAIDGRRGHGAKASMHGRQ